LVTLFWQVLALRFALGIAAGFFVPAVMSMLVDYYPEKQRTQAMGMIGVGVLLGMASN
jgi:MFS family permease